MKRKETAIKKLNFGVCPSSALTLKVQKHSQELEDTVTNDKKEIQISFSNSRKLATIIKYITFVKSDRSILPILLHNGKSSVTDREKADLLNEYFVSVFVNPKMDDSNHTITILWQTCTLSDYCIEKPTFAKLCKDLITRKSRGSDKVLPIIFKETAEAIVSPLHNIFKKIKRLDNYPMKWKNGIVTPIFKKKQQMKGRKPPSCKIAKYCWQNAWKMYIHSAL